MSIKDLKEKIKDLPDTMEVFIDERVTEFTYGLVNSVKVKRVDFVEETGSEVLATDDVLVLSEE